MKLSAIFIKNHTTVYDGVQLLRQVILFVFMGNPVLYKGNLESEQFSLQKQIGERDVFVDFSKDECIYYSNGIVYRNESVLKDVGEIKPDVQYKIVEGVPLPAYELKLAYYGGKLNSYLQDNRAHLSNEYSQKKLPIKVLCNLL